MKLLERKGNPKNTFVVPFLHLDYIGRCAKSIWKHCQPEDHRLIVIDNSEEMLMDNFEIHLYIDAYRNLGCAKAWNTGLRLADTKYVTLMGDDTRIIHRNWWTEVYEFIENDDTGIWFCHPCHLTQPCKVKGQLEPPEFTDEMWGETKRKSGDMVGRFNALIINRDKFPNFLLNEALYPCEQVDGWMHEWMKQNRIPKIGLHFPVWHMRAMTYQRGGLPLHDKGKPNPDYKKCPFEIRQL